MKVTNLLGNMKIYISMIAILHKIRASWTSICRPSLSIRMIWLLKMRSI